MDCRRTSTLTAVESLTGSNMIQLVALAFVQLSRLTLQSLRKSAQRTPAFILQQKRQPEN